MLGRIDPSLVAYRVTEANRIKRRTLRSPHNLWGMRQKKINMTLRTSSHPSLGEKVNTPNVEHRYLSVLLLSQLPYSKSLWRKLKCRHVSTTTKQTLRTIYLLMKDTCCCESTLILFGVKCSLYSVWRKPGSKAFCRQLSMISDNSQPCLSDTSSAISGEKRLLVS